MRGIQYRSDSNKVFFAIKHGTICEESKREREGFKPIQVKNPRTEELTTKYIRPASAVEAIITKIEWRDTGEQFDQRYTSWRIHLDADGTPCILEIPFQSRISTRFMKLAENIDFSRPVEFRAWHDTKTDSTAFFVGQRENESDEKSISVPQKYTRDNPGDCPEPKQRLGGKWDFGDQADFLYQQMVNVVIPRVEAAQGAKETRPETDPADAPERDAEYPYEEDPNEPPF